MNIRFVKQDGYHGPGDIIDVEPHLAALFIRRGVAIEVVRLDDAGKAIHEAPRDKAVKRTIFKGIDDGR